MSCTRAKRSEVKYGGSGVGPQLVSQEKFKTAEGTCTKINMKSLPYK